MPPAKARRVSHPTSRSDALSGVPYMNAGPSGPQESDGEVEMSTSHPRFRLRIAITAILAAVLALNAAATLYAAVTAPTVRACVKAGGPDKGLMRYLPSGKCATGERSLAWNITGPTGATGPQGSAGSSSGSGPTPYWISDWQPSPFFPTETASTKLTLPAGTYLVSLQLEVRSDMSAVSTPPIPGDAVLMTARCTMTAGSRSWRFTRYLDEGWSASIAHEAIVAGQAISVTCSQASASSSSMKATQMRLAIDGLLTATPIAVQ